MTMDQAIAISYEALIVIIKITLPTLALTAAVGFAETIFQQVTNVHEQSLQQGLKIFVVMGILFATAPAIFVALRDYTLIIFDRIASLPPAG